MKSPTDMTASELAAELDRLQSAVGEARRIVTDLEARMRSVAEEHERRTRPTPEPAVSDHALLRYIERVCGINVEELRSGILTPAVKDAVKAGASAVTVNNVKFVVRGNTIVTTLDPAQRPKRKMMRGRPAGKLDWEDELDDAA